MTDSKEPDSKKRLGLARPGTRLELRGGAGDAGQVRQSFPHGRTKTVQVEVKKKRIISPAATPAARAEPPAAPAAPAPAPAPAPASAPVAAAPAA
ncbi:MAG: translation initiation factor IF-2 associated domain-containing protein, partial [Alphaproteobacteria bacterium]